MIVSRTRTIHPQSVPLTIDGTVLEWHLIPKRLLRSIFAPFLVQFLNGLVSWGSPAEYSMIDWYLRGFPASFGVLFCSVVVVCRYSPKPCSQWCKFFNRACVWVWHFSHSVCGSIINAVWYHVQLGAPCIVNVCASAGCTRWFGHASVTTGPRSTTWLLLPSRCFCETILLTLYSRVWNWRV